MTEPVRSPQPLSRATWILITVAVAGAIQAVASFLEKRQLERGLVEVGKYMNVDQAIYRTVDLRGSLSLAYGLGICAAVAAGLLVFLLRTGSRWVRIITWIAGVGLVIGEIVLMAADTNAVKTGDFIFPPDVPGGNPATVGMLNNILVPNWFPPLYYLSEFVVLVGMIAAAIQLAKPEVTDYFHRDTEGPGAQVPADPRVWSLTNGTRDQSPE